MNFLLINICGRYLWYKFVPICKTMIISVNIVLQPPSSSILQIIQYQSFPNLNVFKNVNEYCLHIWPQSTKFYIQYVCKVKQTYILTTDFLWSLNILIDIYISLLMYGCMQIYYIQLLLSIEIFNMLKVSLKLYINVLQYYKSNTDRNIRTTTITEYTMSFYFISDTKLILHS